MEPLALYLVLLFGGVLLLGAEIYVPGGVLGVVGACFLVGAALMGFRVEQFGPYGGEISALLIVFLLVGGMLWWLHFFPRTAIGRRILLTRTGDDFELDDTRERLAVGARGVADTDLRPSGMARIDGKRVDVVANGRYVPRGHAVEVLEVTGSRVVVCAVVDPEAPAS